MGLLRRSKPGSSKSVSLQEQQLKPDNPELDDAIAKRQDDAADAEMGSAASKQARGPKQLVHDVQRAEQSADISRIVAEARLAAPSAQGDPSQEWQMGQWPNSLGLNDAIAAALLSPISADASLALDSADASLALPFVRALGKLGSRESVAALLRQAGPHLLDRIADAVWDGASTLIASGGATGAELHAKFVQEGESFTMSYGGLDTFFGGLEGLIGTPNPKLREAMKREHCDSADSGLPFNAGNYGTTTTAKTEYHFVVDPEHTDFGPGSKHPWPEDTKLREREDTRSLCRKPRPLSDFAIDLQRVNEQLATQDCSSLCDEEFWGARLYTGPMFIKYNAILRGLGGKAPFFVQKLEQLCLGNNYTTTLHIINSACVKLSKIMTAQKVYRGVSGGVLPSEFWAKNEWNVAGGVEFAFMSTTLDKEVALHYGGSGGAGLCFEIQMGMVDRGASLSWLSQYPHESEILFAPMTGLEVLGTRVESGVIVVETRLSVNLTALTIEQVVSRRRKLCMDMCESMQLELAHEMTQAAWSELRELTDGAEAAFDLPGYAKSVLRDMLAESTSHPPEHYNNEANMLMRMKDAVQAKNAVSDLPNGWERVQMAAPNLPALLSASDLNVRSMKSNLKAGGAGALSVLMCCSQAQHSLKASGEEMGPEGAVYLGHGIAGATSITELDVSNNKLCGIEAADEREAYNGTHFGTFCKLLAKNSSLTSLDVSANYILADGTTALCAALAGNKRLKTLKLNDSAMQEAGWIALARMVEDAPSLVVLEANCNLELMRPAEIPAVAKAIASAVGRSKSLTSVDLSSQEWKNGEASGLLPPLLDCKSLATLNLSCAECGPHIGAGLAQRLKGHPALTSLQLDSCELGSGALPICAAVGDCGLTELNLSSNELDAAAANALGEALASSVTLKRIDIQSNLIEEGGVALGKGLAASTSLTELELSDCALGDEGGAAVLEALRGNTTLQVLKMSDNKLSAGVAPALRAIGESTSLTQLDLSENKLGPDACADLAAGIAKNASLRELELNYCALGAGCAALGDALKSNSTLTSLELNDNGIMKAEAALLRDAFRRRAERLRKELDERGEKGKKTWTIQVDQTHKFTGRDLDLDDLNLDLDDLDDLDASRASDASSIPDAEEGASDLDDLGLDDLDLDRE